MLIAGVAAASASLARLAALAPPQLEPFDGAWHSQNYYVEGSVDSVRFLSYVRILHDGVVVDSASTTLSRSFRVRVRLSPGENLITAVLRDSSFAESPPSNTVTVRFETTAGLFIPIPMGAGASFDLNTESGASGARLRVFDMAGDLVARFESLDARTFYSFPWDGLNASGERVRRGPLVAVGTIEYSDGTREVIRRAFLFDPEASP